MEELGGKDIQDVVKEMEDTEFRTSLETKLPAHNTRVKLPTVNERLAGFDGELLFSLFPCIGVFKLNLKKFDGKLSQEIYLYPQNVGTLFYWGGLRTAI